MKLARDPERLRKIFEEENIVAGLRKGLALQQKHAGIDITTFETTIAPMLTPNYIANLERNAQIAEKNRIVKKRSARLAKEKEQINEQQHIDAQHETIDEINDANEKFGEVFKQVADGVTIERGVAREMYHETKIVQTKMGAISMSLPPRSAESSQRSSAKQSKNASPQKTRAQTSKDGSVSPAPTHLSATSSKITYERKSNASAPTPPPSVASNANSNMDEEKTQTYTTPAPNDPIKVETNGEVGSSKTTLQKLGDQFSKLFYGADKRGENTGGQSKCKNLSCPKPENQWRSKQLKSGKGLCPICLAIKAAEENGGNYSHE